MAVVHRGPKVKELKLTIKFVNQYHILNELVLRRIYCVSLVLHRLVENRVGFHQIYRYKSVSKPMHECRQQAFGFPQLFHISILSTY